MNERLTDKILHRLSLLLLVLPIASLYWRSEHLAMTHTPPTTTTVATTHLATKKPNAPTPTQKPVSNNFVQHLLAKIRLSNQRIYRQRQQLLQLQKKFQAGQTLSTKQKRWLSELRHYYALSQYPLSDPKLMQQLLIRVNIIPASLALAQAAQETGWGQSRFAQIANNYFGQWRYRQGCGLVPKHRKPNQHFEVQRFHSALDSVQRYMQNLNTNAAYQAFREQRNKLYQQNKALTGLSLVRGIANYNPSRDQYVAIIRQIMIHHKLYRFDKKWY